MEKLTYITLNFLRVRCALEYVITLQALDVNVKPLSLVDVVLFSSRLNPAIYLMHASTLVRIALEHLNTEEVPHEFTAMVGPGL